MILPTVRDPRLVTVRRGGTLTDEDHRLLALWAAECAESVLALVESHVADDTRPREAIAATRAWADGAMRMTACRAAGGHAMGAARPLSGAPRWAAYSAGQAACVAHVPEHDLGAAAYAIRAAVAAAEPGRRETVRLRTRDRQRALVPDRLRDLVVEDQIRRDAICWDVFGD
ncbi:putative immunity protein [Williamsia sp. SKLECPSW1]